MASNTLKQRNGNAPAASKTAAKAESTVDEHPAGEVQHGKATQYLRLVLFVTYFLGCCATIAVTQFFGAPLYLINRNLYYAYMALTKQSFGLTITTMTQWWSPTVVRISGDSSVAGQLRKTADGRVEFGFPDRVVMVANHQIYTDWIYLWWSAYANSPQMHGHIYIILKESLKYVPIIGPGMMFYGFIFMSRKMAKDQSRLAHRLGKLKQRNSGPMSGTAGFDPMWLLIFPEGTNISDNTKPRSDRWCEKIGVKSTRHVLLPRSTGMFFCLNELKETVDYVYDCTVAYEGIPRGGFGQDYFTLTSSYLEGRPPKSVNMYWRRFAIADIPLEDHDTFEVWLRDRWYEKDEFMEQYLVSGRFPASEAITDTEGVVPKGALDGGYIETEVKPAHWWEISKIFVVLGTFGLLANIGAKIWNVIRYGSMRGYQY